jgi:hypothetical protein
MLIGLPEGPMSVLANISSNSADGSVMGAMRGEVGRGMDMAYFVIHKQIFPIDLVGRTPRGSYACTAWAVICQTGRSIKVHVYRRTKSLEHPNRVVYVVLSNYPLCPKSTLENVTCCTRVFVHPMLQPGPLLRLGA